MCVSWKEHLHAFVHVSLEDLPRCTCSTLPKQTMTEAKQRAGILPSFSFLNSQKGNAFLLHVRATMAFCWSCQCLWLFLSHYLATCFWSTTIPPCPRHTGPTDLLTRELKQTAIYKSVCYDPCCCDIVSTP